MLAAVNLQAGSVPNVFESKRYAVRDLQPEPPQKGPGSSPASAVSLRMFVLRMAAMAPRRITLLRGRIPPCRQMTTSANCRRELQDLRADAVPVWPSRRRAAGFALLPHDSRRNAEAWVAWHPDHRGMPVG